jgi:hypothetical protein
MVEIIYHDSAPSPCLSRFYIGRDVKSGTRDSEILASKGKKPLPINRDVRCVAISSEEHRSDIMVKIIYQHRLSRMAATLWLHIIMIRRIQINIHL